MQRKNGEWINDSGRWMESVPELTTCDALIAMETALAKKWSARRL